MEHWAQNWIVLVKKGPLVTTQELGTDLTFYKATIMVYLMETDLNDSWIFWSASACGR